MDAVGQYEEVSRLPSRSPKQELLVSRNLGGMHGPAVARMPNGRPCDDTGDEQSVSEGSGEL
jgi:hypothetical protein